MSTLTQSKKDKLWEHLLDIEKVTGMPLRKTRRRYEYCPIGMFAPDKDRNGLEFDSMGVGEVFYGNPPRVSYEGLYEEKYADWWYDLTPEDRKAAAKWVQEKIRSR